ncbi:hypothetical protein JMA_37270 (plasmid) [Jeotgalibacillus malaysiensis]|uniref:Uncharacterized protein n=1 Tax=Jeotgalibacillus malaysiensis TaxID=1508404 RepID=A0A0B5ARZ2_9BACL|nr:hypothetical protein [Jeotgalibacillus malaysiensis]AJD93045.1 hypothetical protein JMA_37270 [Jeotgalibacillus malaysiensis]
MIIKTNAGIEYFNEYLELKQEIPNLVLRKENPQWFYLDEQNQKELEARLEEKVRRMRVIIEYLKYHDGVTAEQLLLLTMGVEVEKR